MASAKRIPRICVHCGKDFLARAGAVNSGKAKNCSPSCGYASRIAPKIPVEVRLIKHSDRSGGEDACWPWLGFIARDGYGHMKRHGRTVQAHQVAWEEQFGPVTDGLTLDHLCHSNDSSCVGGDLCPHRRCINPLHLEPVTMRANWERGQAPSAIAQRTGMCGNGHLYDDLNTYRRRNHRGCRACNRAAAAQYRQRIADGR